MCCSSILCKLSQQIVKYIFVLDMKIFFTFQVSFFTSQALCDLGQTWSVQTFLPKFFDQDPLSFIILGLSWLFFSLLLGSLWLEIVQCERGSWKFKYHYLPRCRIYDLDILHKYNSEISIVLKTYIQKLSSANILKTMTLDYLGFMQIWGISTTASSRSC